MKTDWILLFLVLFPMGGAFASYLIGRRSKTGRNIFADAVTVVEAAVLLGLLIRGAAGAADGSFQELAFVWEGFCGFGLSLKLDGFRALYGLVAAFMWMMTTIFSREYFGHYRNRNRYYMFLLMTLSATVGVFLSADLYTTFIFFEIMSFTSYVWVIHDEKEAAMRAGGTYLAVAVIGGMVMLMGLFLLHNAVGTLEIESLYDACRAAWADHAAQLYIAGGLMVFGFGAKAGMFPLHIWLPKAHPVAPAPASALLSGILTKSGVFGILAVSCNLFRHDPCWGMAILLLGVVTMFGGALLAVFSVDLKRTLACSSMSQIGFILVGVGMMCLLGEENALAARGTLLHMVNHSLIKLDLFMVAGVIYMNLHKLDLNEIRGFGRKKPLLMFCFLMGALGIGGIPLWNGYVSKTLLHESIVEYSELVKEAGTFVLGTAGQWKAIEWIFLLTGGMTIAYMLKLFIAVFVEKNENRQDEFDQSFKKYWNAESRFAIVGSSVLLPIMGFLPGIVMDPLAALGQGFLHGAALEHAVAYFTLENLKGAMISLIIGLLVYFGVIRTLLMAKQEDGTKVYVNRWPKWLDLENLIYRPILLGVLPWLFGGICRFLDQYVLETFLKVSLAVSAVACRICDSLADSIILLARKTTHRQVTYGTVAADRDRTGYALGVFMDTCAAGLNKTIRKKNPITTSYVQKYMVMQEKTKRTNRIIEGSLSFALLLVCIGLSLVLIYLLV